MVVRNSSLRAALARGAAPFALGLALASTPAFAQTAPTASPIPTAADAGTPSDEGAIVVTGSRIQRTDLTTSTPLAVVSAEEFKKSGAINVEQVLNTLPQVIPGTTAFSNNPGGGVATLNLRNLGSTRTLVLVNGRRYMFFDTSQRVDLNTIPSFLLSGVDVVTGGASAVYGSDAVAGVVNFRLKNVQGVEMGTEYNVTQAGDGQRWDSHIAIGSEIGDGRGHVTVYGEYYDRKSVFQGDRSFSQVTNQDNATATGFNPGGSSLIPQGRFQALGANCTVGGLTAQNCGSGTVFASSAIIPVAGQPARTYVGSGATNDLYNYAPVNYLMVPQQRWLVGGYADYEVNEHLTAYTEVSFVNNRVDSALAATPFSGNYLFNLTAAQSYLAPADYAALQTISIRQAAAGYTFTGANGTSYNVATQNALAGGANQYVGLSIARRSTEVGLRQNHDDRNAYRALVGFKGDVWGPFKYDMYYSYARTRNASYQSGNLSIRSIQAGLLNGSLDIFGPGAITPAAINNISIIAQNSDISQLQVASGAVTGNIFNLGLGGDDVAIVVGGEYRSMRSQFIPDTALSSGDVVGFNAAKPTQGGYDVKEVFGELNVPIVAHRPFFEKLEMHGAGRYSKYSLTGVGGVKTYAVDAQWAPIKDITFRGSYSKAVRAPNVGELYGGAGQDFASATDPCAVAGNAGNSTITALCLATGVPNANLLYKGTGSALQPNSQIQGVTGGNVALKQERSTSYTFGAVISPRFLPRFHMTVDYFNINVKDAIGSAGGGVANILNLCYYTIQNASSAICQLIHRNPTSGSIDGSSGNGVTYVVQENAANLGYLATSGVDLSADYTIPLNFSLLSATKRSKLEIYFMGTYLKKFDTQPIAGLTTISCAGRFGLRCGNPDPKYKWSTRATYTDGPVSASIKWDHIGAVDDDDDGTLYTVEHIKGYDLFSMNIGFDIGDHYSMGLGVNNMFNKKPPIIGTNAEQANTYPSTYDVLGRSFYVTVGARF